MDLLQSHGGSMIMLAKGNRSQQVTDACHKHGGFYLGSIGGPAAVLAQQSIKHLECVAYRAGYGSYLENRSEDFPAFILVDDKGNGFFQQIVNKQCANCTKVTSSAQRLACCQVIPTGHLFYDCNFTLAGE